MNILEQKKISSRLSSAAGDKMERHFWTEALSIAMMIAVFMAAFVITFKEAILTFFLICLALLVLYFVAIGVFALLALINWPIIFWIAVFLAVNWFTWKVFIK